MLISAAAKYFWTRLKERNGMKKGTATVLIFTLIIGVGGGSMIYEFTLKNDIAYARALSLVEKGRYTEAADMFADMGAFRDAPEQLRKFNYPVTAIESGSGFRVECEYTYDREGNETHREIVSSAGGSGSITKEYDKKERLISLENHNMYQPGRTDITNYSYDSIDRITKANYVSTGAESTVRIKTEYEYNSDNLVRHASAKTYTNGTYTGADEVFCYYDDGRCISKVRYVITQSGEKSESSNITYTYDDYGRLIEKDTTEYNGGVKINQKAQYRYGRDMQLRSSVLTVRSGADGSVTETDFLYRYKAGRLISIVANTDGEEDVYQYTYDSYGNVASYTYTAANGSTEHEKYEYKVAGFDMPEPQSGDPIPNPDDSLGV